MLYEIRFKSDVPVIDKLSVVVAGSQASSMVTRSFRFLPSQWSNIVYGTVEADKAGIEACWVEVTGLTTQFTPIQIGSRGTH